MSESLVNLAETSYSDEEVFTLQALKVVIVDPSLVGSSEAFGDFNSAT